MKLRFDQQAQASSSGGFTTLDVPLRTLMAAAGVQDVVAELVLGHVQRGVQAVYNRHAYFEEKGAALDMLAARLTGIVNLREAA